MPGKICRQMTNVLEQVCLSYPPACDLREVGVHCTNVRVGASTLCMPLFCDTGYCNIRGKNANECKFYRYTMLRGVRIYWQDYAYHCYVILAIDLLVVEQISYKLQTSQRFQRYHAWRGSSSIHIHCYCNSSQCCTDWSANDEHIWNKFTHQPGQRASLCVLYILC